MSNHKINIRLKANILIIYIWLFLLVLDSSVKIQNYFWLASVLVSDLWDN